jgi:hypothetical protein
MSGPLLFAWRRRIHYHSADGPFRRVFKGTAVFQEFRGCGMPCKGLEGSEVGFVYLFELALCITLDLSKPGWAVEIEVDIQVIPVEVIDASGMALGNVHMPHVFSNNHPIFPFNQRIVIALARARLGLLNTELVQQPGNYMIDELRAVIGMKAENLEGELGDGADRADRLGARHGPTPLDGGGVQSSLGQAGDP